MTIHEQKLKKIQALTQLYLTTKKIYEYKVYQAKIAGNAMKIESTPNPFKTGMSFLTSYKFKSQKLSVD